MKGGHIRILHLSSLYPPGVVGGAEKVAAMLAEAQAARGHTVGVVHLAREAAPPRRQNGVEVRALESRNLLWIEDVQRHVRLVTTANKLGQAINLLAARDIAREIERFAPDVVHSHSMVEFPPMLWSAARRSGAAVVHTLHDYDLLCSRATLFRNGAPCDRLHPACAGMKAWKGLFTGAIDAVAAVSQPVLDAHLRFGVFADLAPERRRVIWNAAATRPPHAGVERNGPFTFGFMGRLVREKGLAVLLEACRRLPEMGWRLRIAGHTPEGGERFDTAAEGLPVEFVGFADPSAFLDSVDVLVAPSLWAEPFGLMVVEAFAAGRPVIGSDAGAIGELAGSLGPQWVTPASDVDALARRMTEVLAHGRKALPNATAFRPVLTAASPERMTEAYQDLYAAARPLAEARSERAYRQRAPVTGQTIHPS